MKESRKKAKFRKSSRWNDFRRFMKKKYKVDYITGQPLSAGWQLHHCDMNSAHYSQLREENFICLNRATHIMLHQLYRLSWREVLSNMTEVLERMEIINERNNNSKGQSVRLPDDRLLHSEECMGDTG